MEANLEAVAKRIVNDVLQLGEGDSLGVHTYEHMIPLAKEIVKAARRVGADTIITADSDDVWYDALTNLPEKWLKEPSALQQAVRSAITAEAWLHGPADPSLMKTVPKERWRANEEGALATYKPFENDPVPGVSLGLSSVTQARAKTYGFDYHAWYRSTLRAMAVETRILRERGTRVAEILTGANEGRLTAPGGTDFRFEFHGAEPTVWTGEVRPEKGKKSTYFGSLPSGYVGIALRQGSGEGRAVSTTPIPQVGDFIRGLSWAFENGRVTKVDAKENLDYFELFWSDAKRAEGGDQLGSLSIGLNPEAKYGFLENEIVEGSVTLYIGDNEYLGGTNHCEFGFPMSFKDATLEVDGKKLVVDGRLEV
jgi:leucyl aminopeptidase (aminopeptidase T)